MTDRPKLLKKKEVAAILNITTRTLEEMQRRKQIPYMKIGGVVRFKIEDVDWFISKNTIVKPENNG